MPSTPPVKVPIIGVDKYTKQFNAMTKKLQKVGQVTKAIGRKMTTYITAPILGAGVASAKLGRDLNKAMANVGTLIPKQRERLEKLKQSVQDLAVETGTASTEIAEGLYQTISAFGGTEDPMKKLQLATKMSKAGLATVAESLGLVSTVTKGYGNTTDEAAQKAADLAFTTVKLGETTFPELAASMGKVIPLAATLETKQTELFGAFAAMTGPMGNASEVATQLASLYSAALKPSTALQRVTRKLGYASASSMFKQEGLRESLLKLNEAVGGNSDKMAKMLGRKEALTAALHLTGKGADDFKKKVEAMGKATGATDEAFKEQTEGIDKAGFKWDQFVERVKRLAVRIGDRLLPIIERIIIKLEPFIDKLTNASDESIDLAIKIGGLVAAFGPLISIAGSAISTFAALRGVMGVTGLGKAFTLLNTPLSKTGVGLTGLAKAGKIASTGLKSAGLVAAAGAAGYGVGTLLNKALFEKRNEEYGALVAQAESFTTVDKNNAEQIKRALAETEALKKSLGDKFASTETVFGTVASWFTDVESPSERLKRVTDRLNKSQKELNARLQNMTEQTTPDKLEALPTDANLVKEINVNSKTEAELTVAFSNVPEGVQTTVRQKGGEGTVKTKAKGAVMQGAAI